jgi:hypothetical protein
MSVALPQQGSSSLVDGEPEEARQLFYFPDRRKPIQTKRCLFYQSTLNCCSAENVSPDDKSAGKTSERFEAAQSVGAQRVKWSRRAIIKTIVMFVVYVVCTGIFVYVCLYFLRHQVIAKLELFSP